MWGGNVESVTEGTHEVDYVVFLIIWENVVVVFGFEVLFFTHHKLYKCVDVYKL